MYPAIQTCLVNCSLSFAHVSFSACIYHVSRNLSPASRTLAFTLVYSGLTGVASAPQVSGDLNLIIILVLPIVATCRCFTIFLLHAVFIHVLFFCNKMPTRASGMCLGESVTVCFGISRTSGWPYCTKPWLPSPAGLGNRPLRPSVHAVCACGGRNVGSNVWNDVAGSVT